MRSRYRILEPEFAHFVTGTVVGWLPLFTTAPRCDILVDAFAFGAIHGGEGEAVQLREGGFRSQVQLGNEGQGSRVKGARGTRME